MGVNLNTILNYRLPENQGLIEVAEMLMAKLKALPLPRCTNYDGTLDTSQWAYTVKEQGEETDKWGTYTYNNEIVISSPTSVSLWVHDGVAYLHHIERWGFFIDPEYIEMANYMRYEVFLIASALGVTEVIYAGDNATEWIDGTVTYEEVKAQYTQSDLWTNDFAGYQQAVYQGERWTGLYFLDDFADFREEGKNTPDPAKIYQMYDDYFQNSYYTNDKIRDKIKFAEQAKKGDWYLIFYLLKEALYSREKQPVECLEWADMGIKTLKKLFSHRLHEVWASRFLCLASLTYLWCGQFPKAYELEQYWIRPTEVPDVIYMMERYLAMLLAQKQYVKFEIIISQKWFRQVFDAYYLYYYYSVLKPDEIVAPHHRHVLGCDVLIGEMKTFLSNKK